MPLSVFNKPLLMMLIAIMIIISGPVFAEKSHSAVAMISQINDSHDDDIIDERSTPNSFVALDFSIQNAESWDTRDKPVNQVFNCVNGETITGFEFNNVTIETFAGSFFSEAVIYFTDSNRGDDGIRFIIGANNPNPGTDTFNSNGIIDITDLGANDIVSQNDGKFFMQFYEETDDLTGVADARYTNGILKIWGIDLEPSNDCPFIEAVVEQPDLSVDYNISQTSDASVIGNSITFDVAISNNGNGVATNVMIEHELSSKLSLSDFSCDDGSSFDNVESPINVNNIEANMTLNCSLEATIIAFGEISNSIRVQTNDDSDTSNNSAILVIMGAAVIIPVNNLLALLVLMMAVIFFTRKNIKKSH